MFCQKQSTCHGIFLDVISSSVRRFNHTRCCCSVAQSCPTLCNPVGCSKQSFLSIISWSLLKLVDSVMLLLVMLSNHLVLCCSLRLLHLIFPSITVFSNESLLIRWPNYWSFSFNISPSNEYSGLTSFRMDWLDLLLGQGALKSLLQHHNSKASVLWCSAFFMVNYAIHTWLLEKP